MDNLPPAPQTENSLQSTLEQLLSNIDRSLQQATPLHQIEADVWETLLKLGRQALHYALASAGDGDLGPTVTEPEGQVLHRLENLHSRRYVSIFGVFEIGRVVYGSREGQKIDQVPLDAQLGLPSSAYSYLLQNWSQSLCVESAFGRVSQTLLDIFGQKIGTAALEGMNEQMAQDVAAFRDGREAPDPESEGEILVATADGKGIVLRRPEDDPAPSTHRSKGEKAGKKRMAMVASAYSVDRYLRTAEDVVAALFRDVAPEEKP